MNRRDFNNKFSLSTIGSFLGIHFISGHLLSAKQLPVHLQDPDPYKMFGKDKNMVLLNDRPWNMEARAHLLNDAITPNKYMFIRNNGKIPQNIDIKNWSLTLDGESVKTKKTYSLNELKSRFEHHTYQLTLECGGNGRSEFDPPAKGNQWSVGAVSCAEWTGIRLKDVLKDVGLEDSAVYIGYHAADTHLSGDPTKEPISRGVPIAKAMQDETLLAFKMNGKDIPLAHGYPLRLVCGGWPASASGKWINRISVRNKVHDGAKMGGSSYRVPCETVAPGAKVSDENMCIIQSMPIKSLITYPKTGAILPLGKSLSIKGHAWAGELEVAKMEYSINFGSTWASCSLKNPPNRLAWQHFDAKIRFPKKGYYEVWARATDSHGIGQPMVLPGWNPKGYLNNACHRIAVKVV
ncbi:sulfite oxidase [Flagellimonas allohymeniacidonis]|uniref:Molybdopterin containing oxidoreductase n=1 Tax=Flagellimonas allohymeniacidonis TaxID=2517819 RepID=A0A4Q8QGQ9_9FLAO|nr:sulfite oxidase [Allomuricauda hymeniacidonis]TAI47306.1 molybdopterin containing oxidoreductase [Allomuricauda hymeniacidonis]